MNQECCNRQWRRMKVLARTHPILQEYMSSQPNSLPPPEVWEMIIQKQEAEDRGERLAAHKDRLQKSDSEMRKFLKRRREAKDRKKLRVNPQEEADGYADDWAHWWLRAPTGTPDRIDEIYDAHFPAQERASCAAPTAEQLKGMKRELEADKLGKKQTRNN